MAKEKEQKLARIYFVEHGKTAKEIARLVKVTEKTVGDWVKKYGWKNLRDSMANSKNQNIENVKEILSLCAEERLALAKELTVARNARNIEEAKFIRQQMAGIADEASKWNKTLENINKANKITLEVYITVMERIFQSIQKHDAALFVQLLDFQEEHIHEVSVELG